jgi:hypothetical protein
MAMNTLVTRRENLTALCVGTLFVGPTVACASELCLEAVGLTGRGALVHDIPACMGIGAAAGLVAGVAAAITRGNAGWSAIWTTVAGDIAIVMSVLRSTPDLWWQFFLSIIGVLVTTPALAATGYLTVVATQWWLDRR